MLSRTEAEADEPVPADRCIRPGRSAPLRGVQPTGVPLDKVIRVAADPVGHVAHGRRLDHHAQIRASAVLLDE